MQTVELEESAITPGNETFINLQWNIKAVEAPGAWDAGSTAPASAWRSLTAESTARIRTWTGTPTSPHPGHSFQASPSTRTSGLSGMARTSPELSRRKTIRSGPLASLLERPLSVKALHNGSGPFSQVIAAILYAATPLSEGGGGADIINMSLGATFARGGGNTGAGRLVAALNKAVNFAAEKRSGNLLRR